MCSLGYSGEKTIFGFVSNLQSKERLVGATVIDILTRKGTTANQFGFFSLSIASDSAILKISCIGYSDNIIHVDLTGKKKLEIQIQLEEKEYSTELIVVEGLPKSIHNLTNVVNSSFLNIEQIKRTNATGGEPDILKSVQQQPGVSFKQEGSADYFVRGGNNDQNLILLDGIPVYNPNHFFGFIGAFNLDALKSADFYKGNSSARYGGRLSSVLSLTMKEGNTENYEIQGGISTLSSRLKVEGPIGKCGSFLVAGRRSYLDLIIPENSSNSEENNNINLDAYFYDLNAKLNLNLYGNDRIFISGYYSQDSFDLGKRATSDDFVNRKQIYAINWGNKAYNLRWNHIQSEKLFFNTTVIFSKYYRDWTKSTSEISPSIEHNIVQVDGDYFFNSDNTFQFGTSFNTYLFNLSQNVLDYSNSFSEQLRTKEFIFYASHQKRMFEFLKIEYGFRFSIYNPVDYKFIEPRFSSVFSLTDYSTIKIGYARYYQYVHLLSSVLSGNGVNQIFYPSTEFIKPQKSDQVTAGFFSEENSIFGNAFDFSIELYAKKQNGLPYLLDEEKILSKEEIKNNIDIGTAASYGFEFQIEKKSGRVNGYLNYSYSKTSQNFKTINNGKDFTPAFDRTHHLNTVLSCKINDRWNAGILYVLASGYSISIPEYYFISGQSNYYGPHYRQDITKINNKRLDLYNRMDLNLTYSFKFLNGDFNFLLNIYNIYNHFNPTILFPDINNNTSKFKISSVGVMPTIGLEFKF